MADNKTEQVLWALVDFSGEFLGLVDVGRLLSVSSETVRRWTQLPNQEERLACSKLGGTIRIHRDQLIDFLNRNSQDTCYVDPGFDSSPRGTLEDPDPYSEQ